MDHRGIVARFLGTEKINVPSPKHSDRLWRHPANYSKVTGDKATGAWTWPHPSSKEIKNGCSYTYTSYTIKQCHLTYPTIKFTFVYISQTNTNAQAHYKTKCIVHTIVQSSFATSGVPRSDAEHWRIPPFNCSCHLRKIYEKRMS
jgi:hypothetical protein